jgi:hypothetical protein
VGQKARTGNAEPDREYYEPIIGQCGGALKSRPGGLFSFS